MDGNTMVMDFYNAIVTGKDITVLYNKPQPVLGSRIGYGNYGAVYDHPNEHNKVIKVQRVITDNQGRLYVSVSDNIIGYIDKTIIEVLVMSCLTSDKIPFVYDFGYYYHNGDLTSYIIMERINGMDYKVFNEKYVLSDNRYVYLSMWLDLLNFLSSAWKRYQFVHGDISRYNMIISKHTNSIQLIDFGRSQIHIYNTYFVYHESFVHTNEVMHQCVDICRLVQYYYQSGVRFSDEFETLLDTCTDFRGRKRVPVIHNCSPAITFSNTIHEVETQLNNMI